MGKRSHQREVHQAADKFEPRLARAIAKGLSKVRERVSIYDLAMILERARQGYMRSGRIDPKDIDAALALIPMSVLKDALSPADTIRRDVVAKGRRLGKAHVREVVA